MVCFVKARSQILIHWRKTVRKHSNEFSQRRIQSSWINGVHVDKKRYSNESSKEDYIRWSQSKWRFTQKQPNITALNEDSG